MTTRITSSVFGRLPDGRQAILYTLDNTAGLRVCITNYGAITTSIQTPDSNEQTDEVLLGYDTLAPYLEDQCYLGATIGRYANRIAHGTFPLNGHSFTLPRNAAPHHLHGGHGYNSQLWDAVIDQGRLVLTLEDDGAVNGYLGTVNVTQTISLSSDNALHYDFTARASHPTPINLTNHNYFNLAGQGEILDHCIQIHAQSLTSVDSDLIPTGQVSSVQDTPFDLRVPCRIGDRFNGQFDQNYCISGYNGQLRHAARLYAPSSGRIMDMHTSQPGVQFYTGAHIPHAYAGRSAPYSPHSGLCLEGQHYPDSPNHPHFPSTLLRPGDLYAQSIMYKFSTSNASPY